MNPKLRLYPSLPSPGGARMKKAIYRVIGGRDVTVEYDESAPCEICGEPVTEASMAGTTLCPWCDIGVCRYCGIDTALFAEKVDGGSSVRHWRQHMAWHCDNPRDNDAGHPS